MTKTFSTDNINFFCDHQVFIQNNNFIHFSVQQIHKSVVQFIGKNMSQSLLQSKIDCKKLQYNGFRLPRWTSKTIIKKRVCELNN